MIRASSTNGRGKYPTAVRVYKNGNLVGEVFLTPRNPLAYLKKHKKSKYNEKLIAQLVASGLSQSEIASVYK